ncbi:MAG: sulfurtransferase [Candidatus Latescibacterota bacterium]
MEKLYPVGKGEVKWISTEWMEDHLSDKDLTIIDVQPDMLDYIHEHIPGALYLNDTVFTAPQTGIPGVFLPPEAVQPSLRRLGLRSDAPVAVYSGKGVASECGNGLEQAMVAYSLARFGHGKIYILDGGIEQWKAEKKPLAQEYPDVDSSDFTCRLRNDFFIEYHDFQSIKDNGNATVLDCRPPEQYEGQGPWLKPGHIPGAINLPWRELTREDNPFLLREESEIRSLVDRMNLAPEKTIVCSGGTVRDAALEFLLFKFFLNYPNVRCYEGSFTEWTAYPGNPTAVGKAPHSPETRVEQEVPAGR